MAQLTWAPGGVEITGTMAVSGTWDSTTANWFNGSTDVAWVSGDSGTINGNNATITVVGTQTVSAITLLAQTVITGTVPPEITITGGTLQGSASGLTINAQNENTGAVIYSAITGGTLTITGSGGIGLESVNTYTGGTIITSSFSQIELGGSATLGTGGVVDNGYLEYHRSSAYTEENVISGIGSVTNINTGTLILDAANTYSGHTFLYSGGPGLTNIPNTVTEVTRSTVLSTVGGTTTIDSGPLGTGTLNIDSIGGAGAIVTLEDNGTPITLANSVSLAGTLELSSTGTGSIDFDGTSLTKPVVFYITSGGNGPTFIVDNTTTIADNITSYIGLSGVYKYGAGNLILTGSNSFSGGLIVETGTVSLSNGNAAPSLELNGNTTLRYIGSTSGTFNSIVPLSSGGTTGTVTIINTNGVALTISQLGVGSNPLILNMGGTGSITVTTNIGGTDIYFTNGVTVVNNGGFNYTASHISGNGTLVMGVNGGVPNTLYLGSSATNVSDPTYENGNFTNVLELNGRNVSIRNFFDTAINGSGGTDTNMIVGGSGTLSTLTYTGTTSITFRGGLFGGNTIANGNNLALQILDTSGTVTMSGSNTYAGGTTIMAGDLLVNNTDGSATGSGSFTLNNNIRLGGTGAIHSTANSIKGIVQAGAPGAGTTGSLTLTSSGTTTFASTAHLTFNLAASGANTQLNVADSAVLFSGSTLVLNLVDSSTTTYANGLQYDLIVADGSANQFSGITVGSNQRISGLTLTLTGTTSSGQQDSIVYAGSYLYMDNGNIAVDIQAAPEPNSWALLLGSLAALAFWKSRKHRFRY